MTETTLNEYMKTRLKKVAFQGIWFSQSALKKLDENLL